MRNQTVLKIRRGPTYNEEVHTKQMTLEINMMRRKSQKLVRKKKLQLSNREQGH